MRWKFQWFQRPEPPLPMKRQDTNAPSFAGMLDEAILADSEAHPLAEALLDAHDRVWTTTNMGQTRDENDLFFVIDQLSQGVVATHPSSLCYSGCGRCCHYPTGFFDIFPQEWALIHKYIETEWEPERLQEMLRRFRLEHAPLLWWIKILEGLMGLSITILPKRKALPLHCPFLENDRCSIYPVRPFPCRTFGHFSAKMTPWNQPHPYACADQSSQIRESMAKEELQVMLPDVSTVQMRQYFFVKGKKRLIATWIAKTYREPPRGKWQEVLDLLRSFRQLLKHSQNNR